MTPSGIEPAIFRLAITISSIPIYSCCRLNLSKYSYFIYIVLLFWTIRKCRTKPNVWVSLGKAQLHVCPTFLALREHMERNRKNSRAELVSRLPPIHRKPEPVSPGAEELNRKATHSPRSRGSQVGFCSMEYGVSRSNNTVPRVRLANSKLWK
jgi:hypothetical protein